MPVDSSFHIDKRLNRLPDVQRTYNWELMVPRINEVCDTITDPEDFIIRTRSVTLPSRGNEPIESFFLGMKQVFSGRPIFTNIITVLMEEFEDQAVLQALYEWQENVFSVDVNGTTGGASKKAQKRNGYATDMYINTYKQDHSALPKTIKCVNCWPSQVDEVSLDFQAQESVKYSVSFSFDYWVPENS